MLYLLDTNVISETRKPRPKSKVLDFLKGAGTPSLCLSVMSLGELRRGFASILTLRAASARELGIWIDEIEFDFAERILLVDASVTRIWGELSVGRTRPVVDTLLAATAIRHGLTLVTRNVRDVEGLGVRVLNPWGS